MSTVVIVRKEEFVSIAADSLSKFNASKDPAEYVVNHHKIIAVGRSKLAIVGPTSAKLMLADYFAKLKATPEMSSVHDIFATWNRLHEALKTEYYLNPDEDDDDSVESSRMDVLIANPYGAFGVTAHRAVQEFSRYYAYGYGREYAMGAMFAAYGDSGRSAEDVARLAVAAAAEFDNGTGPPIDSYSIRLT